MMPVRIHLAARVALDAADPAATPRGLRAVWPSLRDRIASGDLTTAARMARPQLPARFAFITRLDSLTKPFVYRDGPALARSIHRRRAGAAIEVRDTHDLREAGARRLNLILPRDRVCPGVQVLLIQHGDPIATLGWIWADGAEAEAVRRLIAAHPIPLTRRQTAD